MHLILNTNESVIIKKNSLKLRSSKYIRGRRSHDRMIVGFPTTYAISAYHH
jgi:hypothetical protein